MAMSSETFQAWLQETPQGKTGFSYPKGFLQQGPEE